MTGGIHTDSDVMAWTMISTLITLQVLCVTFVLDSFEISSLYRTFVCATISYIECSTPVQSSDHFVNQHEPVLKEGTIRFFRWFVLCILSLYGLWSLTFAVELTHWTFQLLLYLGLVLLKFGYDLFGYKTLCGSITEWTIRSWMCILLSSCFLSGCQFLLQGLLVSVETNQFWITLVLCIFLRICIKVMMYHLLHHKCARSILLIRYVNLNIDLPVCIASFGCMYDHITIFSILLIVGIDGSVALIHLGLYEYACIPSYTYRFQTAHTRLFLSPDLPWHIFTAWLISNPVFVYIGGYIFVLRRLLISVALLCFFLILSHLREILFRPKSIYLLRFTQRMEDKHTLATRDNMSLLAVNITNVAFLNLALVYSGLKNSSTSGSDIYSQWITTTS